MHEYKYMVKVNKTLEVRCSDHNDSLVQDCQNQPKHIYQLKNLASKL